MDECELGNACGTGSLCTNTDGGFQCSCPPGFTGDARVACVDIDECGLAKLAGAQAVCGRSAICDNLPGSFRCQCPPGFKGNPAIACEGLSCPRPLLSAFFFFSSLISISHETRSLGASIIKTNCFPRSFLLLISSTSPLPAPTSFCFLSTQVVSSYPPPPPSYFFLIKITISNGTDSFDMVSIFKNWSKVSQKRFSTRARPH